MTDFNPYAIKTVFTVHEAAAAIHGIARVHKDDSPVLKPIIDELLRAMVSGELPCTRVPRYAMPPRYRVGEPVPLIEAGTDWMESTIASPDLLAWCESRNIRTPLLFPDPARNVPQKGAAEYHTPALDALHPAVRRFWLNHDSRRPPKAPEVVDWLKNERGMTQTMAEAIDRIIRPEEYRKGGNRGS